MNRPNIYDIFNHDIFNQDYEVIKNKKVADFVEGYENKEQELKELVPENLFFFIIKFSSWTNAMNYTIDDITTNSWYGHLDFWVMLKEFEFKTFIQTIDLDCIEHKDYNSYKRLININSTIQAEMNNRDRIRWFAGNRTGFIKLLLLVLEDVRYVLSERQILSLIHGTINKTKNYFETIHPEWKRGIESDEENNVVLNPFSPIRGMLYEQINIAFEIGLITAIENKYSSVNDRTISPNEIGAILHDIFKHGEPKQWAKCFGQYRSGSANDPIRSTSQKNLIGDFLRVHKLK